MNYKQIIGAVLAIIGVFLIIFAIHAKLQSPPDKTWTEQVSIFFTQNPMWNPIIEFFGGTPETKPIEYHPPYLGKLLSGIALVLCGGVIAFVCRNRKW